MAFKKVSGSQSGYDTMTWDKFTNKVIEGKYVEKQENVAGKPGANIFVLENEDGKWAVWSGTALEASFAVIPVGSLVRVEYLGKEKTKNGREFNKYEVSVDDGK
jgi:hypothetical protein